MPGWRRWNVGFIPLARLFCASCRAPQGGVIGAVIRYCSAVFWGLFAG